MLKVSNYLTNPLKIVKNKKGLTLIELLAVIVILAIIFVVLARNLGFGTEKAKQTDVQQGFKPYITAFESMLNEYSGLPTNSAGNIDLSVVNNYLAVDYQISSPAVGSQSSTTVQSTKFKDPWKQYYTVQAKKNTNGREVLIVRTSGKDQKTGSDSFSTSGENDKDDVILITQYVDGSVKSCSYGLEKNIGSAEVSSSGVISGCK